jgi:hypothetical protein
MLLARLLKEKELGKSGSQPKKLEANTFSMTTKTRLRVSEIPIDGFANS